MQQAEQKTIYTIGHSTRTIEEFTGLLKMNNIELVADIRSFPGSRKFPQFNKEVLSISLHKEGIDYVHIEQLGGRRKVMPNSPNTAWHNSSFRGYADYMQTDAFKNGIHQLEKIAQQKRTAYMCSEAVWWRCHRALVSDYLKLHGWKVLHIMDKSKVVEHPYTPVAKVVQGNLFYNE